MDDFIIRALLAGIGVALVAGPLGCFVVWRRMAYFGDSLSHSALLGIALGLAYGITPHISIVVMCWFCALLLVWLRHKKILTNDTLLGIFAHSGLSIGVVVISVLNMPSFNLHSYLFGDILTTTIDDLLWIYIGGCIITATIIRFWPAFILTTIHEDIAKAEGISTLGIQLILMTMLALMVAICLHIVGVLLVTSMLIIPAATSRQLASSPTSMAIGASCFGMLAVVLGLFTSFAFDTPTGPSIVSTSAIIFTITLLFSLLIQKIRRTN